MKNLLFIYVFILSMSTISCAQKSTKKVSELDNSTDKKELTGLSKAYFASGCFWCVEAVYESVEGVEEVISGYSGGHVNNPSYQMIGTGKTGHTETVEVYYDPEIVDYKTLLIVFFGSGDPTTLNRQGPDAGTQYRSSIFFQNEDEKRAAETMINDLTESQVFENPIVTEVVPLEKFWPAEDYHQDYEKLNPNQPYVKAVSIPRLKRFQAAFPNLLKK